MSEISNSNVKELPTIVYNTNMKRNADGCVWKGDNDMY